MATSGSYSYNLNTQSIINQALTMINIIPTGTVLTNSDTRYNDALVNLNMMVKLWETEGLHLWKRRLGFCFTANGQNSYQLGSVSGSDNCTNVMASTLTNSPTALGVNTIVVSSTSGFSVSQNIGLELDNGTRQWGTISSINTGTNTITLSFTTTTTSASGNTVVAYSSLINRPLKVLKCNQLNLKTSLNTEITMQKISYDQYFEFPVKNSKGNPNNFYYDTVINNALPYTGTLYVYPTPNQVSVILKFIYLDCIQDMINATDTVDFPQEWLFPLVYNLALYLSYSYGKFESVDRLAPLAQQMKETLLNFDADDENLEIGMDWAGMRMTRGFGWS